MIQRILLRLPEEHWQKLMAYHFAEKKRYEALSFLWGYTSVIQKTPLICVPHNVERLLLAPDCFETQSGGHLRLRKSVQVGITMEFARSTYNTLINIHDHADILMPSFSGTDDNDDLRQDENIRNHLEPLLRKDPDFVPRHVFNASLVLARNGVDGRLTDVRMRQSPFLPIDEIQVIGTTFQRIETTSCRANNSPKNRDERSIRHRDFIQLQQQDVLSDLKVAVVGAGGIGSILAEGLLRSGVGDVTIIDHDDVSESNLNRWQSGRPCDLGKPKATTLAARLRIMFPTARIRAINRQLYTPAVERVLARSDAIMGAVDSLALYDAKRAASLVDASIDDEEKR